MLKHSAVLISLSLAGLYALGLTFHQGFLREFGIEETQFILTADRTFFQGFVSAMSIGSKGLIYLFLSAAGVILVAEFGYIAGKWINRTDIYYKSKLFFARKSNVKPSGSSFGDFSAKLFAYIGLSVFLYLLLLAALISSDRAGGEYAKNFIENAQNGSLQNKAIKLNNKDSIEGYTIICNTLQCAYLVNGKAVVFSNRDVFSVSNIEKNDRGQTQPDSHSQKESQRP